MAVISTHFSPIYEALGLGTGKVYHVLEMKRVAIAE